MGNRDETARRLHETAWRNFHQSLTPVQHKQGRGLMPLGALLLPPMLDAAGNFQGFNVDAQILMVRGRRRWIHEPYTVERIWTEFRYDIWQARNLTPLVPCGLAMGSVLIRPSDKGAAFDPAGAVRITLPTKVLPNGYREFLQTRIAQGRFCTTRHPEIVALEDRL